MSEKQYHVQRIYKGMDNGVKYYDWCVMKDDTVILRLSTRMDCKDVVEVLNELSEENEQLRKDATTLIYANQDYRKENEQLKQNCKNYEWYKQYKAVLNENEQLQKKNDNLVHMIARVQYRADSIKDKNEQLKADKQSLIDFIKKEFPKSHKHILEGFE